MSAASGIRFILAFAAFMCVSGEAQAQVGSGGTVTLIMSTDDARARLYVAPEGGERLGETLPPTAVPLCAAPCLVTIPPGGRWFYAGGEGLRTSRPFSLAHRKGPVDLDVVGSSTSSRTLGYALAGVGGTLVLGGVLAIGVSPTQRERGRSLGGDNGAVPPPQGTPLDGIEIGPAPTSTSAATPLSDGLLIGGVTGLFTGVIVGSIGLGLAFRSTTRVEVSPPRRDVTWAPSAATPLRWTW